MTLKIYFEKVKDCSLTFWHIYVLMIDNLIPKDECLLNECIIVRFILVLTYVTHLAVCSWLIHKQQAAELKSKPMMRY